jgi:hypothetical protein
MARTRREIAMEKLIKVQKELKAPKNQYNSFGKYKYRSAEDILEAVKPLCADNGLLLTLSDTLESIGERYYVKATATVIDAKSKTEVASVTAYAREEETKKGMDSSQITGTASSYARKYALNGLFLIDDTKDADTDAYKEQQLHEEKKAQDDMQKKISKRELADIKGLMEQYGIAEQDMYNAYGIKRLEDMTKANFGNFIQYTMSLSKNSKTIGVK